MFVLFNSYICILVGNQIYQFQSKIKIFHFLSLRNIFKDGEREKERDKGKRKIEKRKKELKGNREKKEP